MKNSLRMVLVLFVISVNAININCTNKKQSNSNAQKEKIVVITPEEFKEKSANQVIIDVRTPKEFSDGHIEGAVNINFLDENFIQQISNFDKDKTKPVFIYCKSGNRSGKAAAKISEIGYEKIYDLDGGILNWVRNNNEVIK
jgi:phage shock protein E